MQTVRLELTVAEVNQILGALGERPFAQVYQLIEKIRGQADIQVNPQPDGHGLGVRGTDERS